MGRGEATREDRWGVGDEGSSSSDEWSSLSERGGIVRGKGCDAPKPGCPLTTR